MRPSQKAASTGIALAETLKHFAKAASFLFGTFSVAEKEKLHPQASHTLIPFLMKHWDRFSFAH
ncbi:hypothetical protein [Mucilaginibacter sp. 21P]|uniref:hypothetical protein n=1 Tax=Mucilaginibacter sp. 21P TaxID=2778902 RepID=UPI001C59C6A6|nr:hypothetical protein [Mucilaginibacter sp. 21P]